MHIAVESGDTEIVKFLLAHHADVSAEDGRGRTLLQYAEFLQSHPEDPAAVASREKLHAIIALLK